LTCSHINESTSRRIPDRREDWWKAFLKKKCWNLGITPPFLNFQLPFDFPAIIASNRRRRQSVDSRNLFTLEARPGNLWFLDFFNFLPMVDDKAISMPELRTPVMIFVEARWHDESGSLQKTRACMQDKSAGGAGLRFKTPVAPGTQLRIQWRFEEFSGIVKYSRPEGRDYLVGVQRENEDVPRKSRAAISSNAEADISNRHQIPKRPAAPAGHVESNEQRAEPPQVSLEKSDSSSREPQAQTNETAGAHEEVQNMPLLQSANLMNLPVPRPRRESLDQTAREPQRTCADKELELSHDPELPKAALASRRPAEKERKPMAQRWLGMAWNKPDESSVEPDNAVQAENAKEMPMPHAAQISEKPMSSNAREVPTFQVELLPVEDLYRTAGIASPGKSYSVTKIAEMLHSEHIRGLSKETKRAALLMALDAAGVTVEQVERDAKARQNSLNAYESEQKKQAEAEWARKAEEIAHIQAELESIKAHYTARITRNMEALARDKARFNTWVTAKEQESQSMAEAIELCLKSPGPEPVAHREPEMSATAGSSATAAAGSAKLM
jgi:hypothetical protein